VQEEMMGSLVNNKKIINLGREILFLGSVRESIMTPSEPSSEKMIFITQFFHNFAHTSST
jgi:hypothetical protein